jgi:type I restriction enzyme R subunit
MPTPEDKARQKIDEMLINGGWVVQDYRQAQIHAGRGVVLRNFPLTSGHGFADYLLYVDGKAAGIVEAKKEGFTLTGVEVQSEKYSKGLPQDLPVTRRPLPFLYQSTGVETRFTNGLDPQPRSRPVFSFHRPETLAAFIPKHSEAPRELHGGSLAAEAAPTLRGRLRALPPLSITGLWPAQVTAINNLEKSLAQDRPRALIQMATGSGKTFTAINFIYRLIKFGGAKRILFLVDRGNLGDQTLKEFQQYVSPYNNFKFTEEFIVQRLAGNTLDTTARVCISTIQRLYSMLKGRSCRKKTTKPPCPVWNGCSRNLSRWTTTRPFPSKPSTSSSPTNATDPSTTSGRRCWNTSMPTSSVSPPHLTSRPSASSSKTSSWNTTTSRPWPTASTSTTTYTASAPPSRRQAPRWRLGIACS